MTWWLGGEIDREPSVPGQKAVLGRGFVYVSLAAGDDISALFNALIEAVAPPIVTYGGAMMENCQITTPSGEAYFGLSYKGDHREWTRQITGGASALGRTLGYVEGDMFRLEYGRIFRLEDCLVEFTDVDGKVDGASGKNGPA